MRLAASLLLALVTGPAAGQTAPILDPGGFPPGATSQTQAAWARFIGYNTGRVFAVGPKGESGFIWGSRDLAQARTSALRSCAERAGVECQVFAVDLEIVAPGRAWKPASQAPASIGIGGFSWDIKPDDRYLWQGPTAARGAIVFGHGYGGADADSRGAQPQTWVRHFNLAGYDVLRFERAPTSDGDAQRSAAWLREGLTKLRALGYRHVVVGGQSRGGWNALQALDTPGLIDVAIAVSAAAHGSGASLNLSAQADQLRDVALRVKAPNARVAMVQFALDPFVGDFEARARNLRDGFAPRVAATLLIDRPEGFNGHGAGGQWQFADRFGSCLVRFATEASPPARCE